MKRIFFRPLRLAVAGFLTILVAAGFVIGLLSWRNELRLAELQAHIAEMQQFQDEILTLEQMAIDQIAAGAAAPAGARSRLREEVQRLAAVGARLRPPTHSSLQEAVRLLNEEDEDVPGTMRKVLGLFGRIAASEGAEHQRILDSIARSQQIELRLALAVPLLLFLLAAVIVVTTHRRVYKPLRSLEALLSRVADGRFATVSADGVEPILLPLFHNYNALVSRLQELEELHRSRAESLEQEVRLATGALLEQQQSLARAQRMAVTGELAASVAHELRNPLAAIQMALRNLRGDVRDPDLAQRLALVADEVDRLGRLLNDMLTLSRHAPEPPRRFGLAGVVRQLVELTRYQLPTGTEIDVRIPDGLFCRLPADSLRQALLNLILNAAQALPGGHGRIVIGASRDGETLALTVDDDGPGFHERTLSQAARPFFSTRDQGTGLGLALVTRFARESGGRAELSNRDSGGARVKLVLPCEVDRE